MPIFALAAAPFAGSFVGVLIERLPAAEPVVFGRSRCAHCHTPLAPLDLIPLLSWLVRRGCCGHCGKPIGLFYPAVEIAAVAVVASALVIIPAGDGATLLFGLLLGWILLALAWIDVRHYVLPDKLTLPLIAFGLLATSVLASDQIFAHVAGALAGYLTFAVISAIYRRLRGRDGLGGGDAKLFAAAGAWLSWSALPSVLLLASLIGLLSGRLATGTAKTACQERSASVQDKIAFGPALAAAIWLTWLFGPIELAR